MNTYQLRFWFEHGGFCIWSINDYAKDKYGYAISNDALPISEDLINEIRKLEEEYATYLDWNCPQNSSQWTNVFVNPKLYHILIENCATLDKKIN